MEIECSSGSADVAVGTTFSDEGVEWEVVGFRSGLGGITYSPSSLGGVQVVVCRPNGKLRDWWKQFFNADGTIDWCGDSIAAKLLSVHDGKSRSARGDVLTKPDGTGA